ncbi:MAG: hypothetical protein MUF06_23095 [Pirellulaceae bacterium]|nr:hypothetical protein [Pirellulaceae bacterium]
MNTSTATVVRGLQLPELVLKLISTGRWVLPTDPVRLGQLFYEFSPPNDLAGPRLYLPKQMLFESEGWFSSGGPVGEPDEQFRPGDIDPASAVLIGDVGVGWDEPFALDFRTSLPNPSVIQFHFSRSRWIQIAPTIESFVEVLQM